MAKRFQLRRGTNAESLAFTGALGEVIMDTTNKILVVHDGTTAGGLSVAARGNANNTVTILNRAGTVLATIPATGLLNNTLTSTATDQALTALQGKVLQDGKLDASANAVSATKLVTSRTLNGVGFDGTANIIVPASSTNLLTTGTDLNSITTVGFYSCSISSTAATFLNCPTNVAFGLLVTLSAGCIQELTEYNTTGTPKTFKRHMYGGSWGAWYEVLTTLNPDTTKLPLTGGTLTGGLNGTTANFSSTANFSGQVTLGNGLSSTVPISFLNGGTAQKINTGGVLVSNSYTDTTLVPTNGIYSKGGINVGNAVVATTLTGLGTGDTACLTSHGYNLGTTYGYVPLVAGAVQSNAGYRQNVSIGVYRPSSDWTNSGVYIATGGNDSYPTEAYQLRINGILAHSSNLITIPHNFTVNGTATATAFSGTLTGNVVANTIVADSITGSLTGNATSAGKLSSQYGSAPSYAARAWGALRGTGTVAVLAGGNILSITDNGVGDYTVSFITPMPTATYAVVFGNVIYNVADIGSYGSVKSVAEKTVNGFRIAAGGQSYVDLPEMYIGVFH